MQSHQSPAKARLKSFAIVLVIVLTVFGTYRHMSTFPEPGLVGQPKAKDTTGEVRKVAGRLEDDLLWLCNDIGRRTSRFSPQGHKLITELEFVMGGSGFEVEVQEYKVGKSKFHNVVGVRKGLGSGTILIGTHYDSYGKSPCANASGTGVVTVLELVRKLGREQVDPTVIVGFFGTGEEPHVGEETMGAQVWLDAYREEGRTIDAAYLVGSFGCFREGVAGQNSAFPWYLSHPESSDWVGVYGSFTGRGIVEETLASWERATKLPARGFAAPHWMLGIPSGDQIPFQEAGIPAVLLSDTGSNRDAELRKSADVPYVIDYQAMAQRVIALTTMLRSVITSPISGEAVASAD